MTLSNDFTSISFVDFVLRITDKKENFKMSLTQQEGAFNEQIKYDRKRKS